MLSESVDSGADPGADPHIAPRVDSRRGRGLGDGIVIGATLAGRYLVEDVLGRGGMSVVYRARDTMLGRTVAIKSFTRGIADASDLRRQSSEVQLLASLNHPALVTLFDAVADEDDAVSLIMEYVPGVDLGRELTAGALSPGRAALIGLDLARALAYIHDRGIVHRDIKPANVLVPELGSADGSAYARLADFGIARIVDTARLTGTGSVIGTAGYLSPEQALGRESGPASDVYSLGLVLLECLTGKRVFEGSAVEAAAARISRDPEIPSKVPAGWRDLLARMTAREPFDRLSALGACEVLASLSTVPPPSDRVDRDVDRDTNVDLDTALMTPAADEPPTALLPATAVNGSQTEQPTESLPTRVLSAGKSQDAPTERWESAGHDGTVAPGATRGRRFSPWIAVIVAISVLLLGAAVVGTMIARSADEAPAAVDYPVVEGDLGTHLDQLQRSVDE